MIEDETVSGNVLAELAVDLDVTERIVGEHVLFHPLVGLNGSHLPTAVAARADFDEGETFLQFLVLESLADGGFGLAHIGGSVDALAGHIVGAGQGGQKLGDTQGIAVEVDAAAIRSGGGLHANEGGRSHLTTGHAVNTIVDEHHGDVLAAVGSMDGLSGADSSQVAVALIGEDEAVGVETLDGGGNCWSTAMGSLLKVDIKIIVGKHGTSDRGYTDGLVLNTHLVDNLGDDAVSSAVAAAGAIVHNVVGQHFGFCINQILRFYYI